MQALSFRRNFNDIKAKLVNVVTFFEEHHSAVREILALSLCVRVNTHIIEVLATARRELETINHLLPLGCASCHI